MSKGSKQQYKQFTINNINDACVVLSSLISNTIVNIGKYQQYSNEAADLLDKTETEYIVAKEYDDINDKLLHRQHELLRHIADHQSSSFSYMNFRELLIKKKYLSQPLSEKISMIVKELLDIRNWTFHNPQSLLTASKEVAEKRIPEELKEKATIIPQLNPIIVPNIERYEILMLASLVIHTEKRLEQFNIILEQMKKDYQELFDSLDNKPLLLIPGNDPFKVQYVTKNIISRLSDFSSDIAQISMAIQKSKYNGSDSDFNKWVLSPNDDNKRND